MPTLVLPAASGAITHADPLTRSALQGIDYVVDTIWTSRNKGVSYGARSRRLGMGGIRCVKAPLSGEQHQLHAAAQL